MLVYAAMPVDAKLTSRAETTNDAVTVRVDPAYEGDFEVRTTNTNVAIIPVSQRDPWGKGRTRAVHYDNGRTTDSAAVGYVDWGEAKKPTGSLVFIKTSNSAASLQV
jgi:hypothetical protein